MLTRRALATSIQAFATFMAIGTAAVARTKTSDDETVDGYVLHDRNGCVVGFTETLEQAREFSLEMALESQAKWNSQPVEKRHPLFMPDTAKFEFVHQPDSELWAIKRVGLTTTHYAVVFKGQMVRRGSITMIRKVGYWAEQ